MKSNSLLTFVVVGTIALSAYAEKVIPQTHTVYISTSTGNPVSYNVDGYFETHGNKSYS